ncbi:MAG: LLM class flavin-dependent oxidoreductase [Acidimicrobiia bacterium]
MSLGFALISCQRSPDDPRTWTDLYRQAIELTKKAESLGFGSVWTTEHHFVDDGYMPSLLPVSAALGASTERIEIGTGVLLAPLYHPLRLAEDAATVSLLAEGRFTLGLGLGWSAIEFDAFGEGLSKRGRAMEEILAVLPQAWSGEVVKHHGPIYDIPEVAVRPYPEAALPIVVGGTVDAAVKRAARGADGFFSNASRRRLAHQIEVGISELERVGRDPEAFRWIYYAVAYPCDDPDKGWEEIREHVWRIRWKYSDMEASAHRTGPLASAPPLDAEGEERLRAFTLLGTAEQLADQFGEIRSESGVDLELVSRSYFPGLTFEHQTEVLERLAEVVALLG